MVCLNLFKNIMKRIKMTKIFETNFFFILFSIFLFVCFEKAFEERTQLIIDIKQDK